MFLKCAFIFWQVSQINKLKAECNLKSGTGPCVRKLDEVLCDLNVERQAYYGKTFIGNHVNKMLKVYKTFKDFI